MKRGYKEEPMREDAGEALDAQADMLREEEAPPLSEQRKLGRLLRLLDSAREILTRAP